MEKVRNVLRRRSSSGAAGSKSSTGTPTNGSRRGSFLDNLGLGTSPKTDVVLTPVAADLGQNGMLPQAQMLSRLIGAANGSNRASPTFDFVQVADKPSLIETLQEKVQTPVRRMSLSRQKEYGVFPTDDVPIAKDEPTTTLATSPYSGTLGRRLSHSLVETKAMTLNGITTEFLKVDQPKTARRPSVTFVD